MTGHLAPPDQTLPLAASQLTYLIELGTVTDVEVAWPDHSGHVLGKRIPVSQFIDRATGPGFPFCSAALAWNAAGDVVSGVRLSSSDNGFPDVFAIPDPLTARPVPWRSGAWQVLADLVDHHRHPVAASPRQVLRQVIARLARLGYTARVGVELEFFVLRSDGSLLQDGIKAYSLEKSNELDPLLGAITGLGEFVPVEGALTEYGPGQVEVNLAHAEPLTAADDAFRLRYAIKELARQHGLIATFMAKPFNGHSGSSSHVHISLWRDGEPAFAPVNGAESPVARQAVAGLLAHLPALVLYGSPTVNSYKRFEPNAFAPVTAAWGGDNRTASIRSLLETPAASRIELRTGSADANPYWLVAAVLAAIVTGLENGAEPPERGEGDLSRREAHLPLTLGDAVAAARADEALTGVLGEDAAHDYTVLTESEWTAYTRQVTAWETGRYLRSA